MYFPMLGASALLGGAYQFMANDGRKNRLWLPLSTILWLSCLTFFTYRQILTWRNDIYLWKHTIQLDPADWRSMDQLVEYYVKHGKTEEATVYFDRIEWHSPTVGLKAEMHFAKFRIMRGKLMEACAIYASAMNKYGDDPILYNNLGVCSLQKDNRSAALDYFKRGLKVAVQDRHRMTLSNNTKTLEANLNAMKSRGKNAERYRGHHAFIF